MFRDLFNELIKLLAIDPKQNPISIGFVAIKHSRGAVSEILVITISLVVGVNILEMFGKKIGKNGHRLDLKKMFMVFA